MAAELKSNHYSSNEACTFDENKFDDKKFQCVLPFDFAQCYAHFLPKRSD
jgi:hypothetical protein